MQRDILNQLPHQNCINALNRMLELAMQTAEAASAEKNHRLVLQAVREVTRVVTLINKIACSPNQKQDLKGKSAYAADPHAALEHHAGKWEKSGKNAGKIESLERFFIENKLVKQCEKIAPGVPAVMGGKTASVITEIPKPARR